MSTIPWMTQLSSFNHFDAKSEQFSQFAHTFHRVQMCLGFFDIFDISDIKFKLCIQIILDMIMPKPVHLMTVQEAHKEFNTLTDQIQAKYELLDSGECGKVGTLAFDAECSELGHLMA